MKNCLKVVGALCFGFVAASLFPNSTEAAQTHTIEEGDTLYQLGIQYGVPTNDIIEENNLTSDVIYIGDTLVIPGSIISQSEKQLLAQLIHAEAESEPYAGKVAVGTVVLNRVDSSEFPNSISDVIYDKSYGYYAFSPVENGRINNSPNSDSVKAAEEAISFRGQGSGSLYFYNPDTATNNWIANNKQQTIKIGSHVFAK
ncbi:cell wall hydrolase [Bacillus carboniphilus]|uniref:Cell wall hydrolase n=1 Tax=Bacillus carboniphilus TaxID=86663 RepID=A0ABY9JXC1_9BACI|nr:cell wall hydrolase [Bacillus carboniphilus]WLR43153.1 cell wall hydrolase [Bacillus carboniphilus]